MVVTEYLSIRTSGRTDIVDITRDCQEKIKSSGLSDGILTLFVPGSTASLTTIEFEPNLVKDFKEALEKVAPSTKVYEHAKTWLDDNGVSHVRASLMGPSMTVPFSGGRLALGTWQQIVLCDFDTRPRTREIVAQMLGECPR